MDKVSAVPAAVRPASKLRVIAGRPCLLDKPVKGKYPFVWHRGPTVLQRWLESRRKP